MGEHHAGHHEDMVHHDNMGTDGHEHGDEENAAHDHDFPPAMGAFHDVLKPLWHAEQGAQRLTDTCAKISDLRDAAQGIYDAGAPEGADAEAWEAAHADLAVSVDKLENTCNDEPGALEPFQKSFQRVHDAFHALMATMGMKH